MSKKDSQRRTGPIGETLREHRISELRTGLREMARHLGITPAHLTDIEKGRRTPSDELLVKISQSYEIPVAELRAGWSRPEGVVAEVASQDPVTAAKVPAFLRMARGLTSEQWDRLIDQAKRMAKE